MHKYVSLHELLCDWFTASTHTELMGKDAQLKRRCAHFAFCMQILTYKTAELGLKCQERRGFFCFTLCEWKIEAEIRNVLKCYFSLSKEWRFSLEKESTMVIRVGYSHAHTHTQQDSVQ